MAPVSAAVDPADPAAIEALRAAVAGAESTPLTGGVSSDIRLIEWGGRSYCIKQALPRLKVEADWRAPVERNHSEAEWLRVASGIVPGAAPQVIYEDQAAGWFVMEYLPPAHYPLWKAQLRDGIIIVDFAAQVGRDLARIHAATAGSSAMAERFATDHIFYPIRPEPYLVATGRMHPDLEPRLRELSDATMRTHVALVHGDVSPKNILAGSAGPVFLDAECAWYGDPAFDLAFVLNHMLLKCAWRPQWTAGYLACFDALVAGYTAGVDWEPRPDILRRTAHLLPGLLLGRIDGKSPVEYITDAGDKDMIRDFARKLLLDPAQTPAAVRAAWAGARGAMHRPGG